MRRLAAAAALTLLPAASAAAQSTPAPSAVPPLMSVHIGAVTTSSVCELTYGSTVTAPTWGISSLRVVSRDQCRSAPPVRLRNAQHMRIRLRDPAATIGATFHRRSATAQLTAQPVGPLPTARWTLDVPTVTGSVVLVVGYAQVVRPDGAVAQDRRDFKLRIRRPPGTPVVTPSPAPPETFQDSG
jgi:hypothetical protein